MAPVPLDDYNYYPEQTKSLRLCRSCVQVNVMLFQRSKIGKNLPDVLSSTDFAYLDSLSHLLALSFSLVSSSQHDLSNRREPRTHRGPERRLFMYLYARIIHSHFYAQIRAY